MTATKKHEYNSITKAVRALHRRQRKEAKAAKLQERAPKAPTYKPNLVNYRSDTLARILYDYRVKGTKFASVSLQICRRRARHNVDFVGVTVSKHGDKKSSNLCNVFFCNNAIHCPHCKSGREAKTRDYLNNCVSPAAKDSRLRAGMLTITCKHEAAEDASDLNAYKPLADAFYAGLAHYHSNSFRIFNKMKGGYITGIEAPMGSNGLHIHAHEFIFFDTSLSEEQKNEYIAELKKKAIAALEKFGLTVAAKCIHYTEDFDIGYIAKSGTPDIDAKDSEKDIARKRADYELTREKDNHGESDNKEFVEYLDDAKRGDKKAEIEVVRHLLAMGGRDRWIVSRRLLKILNIPCLSAYKATHGEAQADKEESNLVAQIHPEAFNIAAELINERPAIALILRAAKNEEARPGSVGRMVDALVKETMSAHEARITLKHYKIALKSVQAIESTEKDKGKKQELIKTAWTIARNSTKTAIDDYRASIKERLIPIEKQKAKREKCRDIAWSNYVGMDYINGAWIETSRVVIPQQKLEEMRAAFSQELEFN